MDFGSTLKTLRKMAGKSRYRLAQLSGIDQAYLLRLERGEQTNPSRDLVIRLGLALVFGSQVVTLENVDELLLSARIRSPAKTAPAGSHRGCPAIGFFGKGPRFSWDPAALATWVPPGLKPRWNRRAPLRPIRSRGEKP